MVFMQTRRDFLIETGALNQSDMKYFFVEQEEYVSTSFESMEHNMNYLKKLKS